MGGTSSQDQNEQSNHSADAFEPLLSSEHNSNDGSGASSPGEQSTYASIPVTSRRQPQPSHTNDMPPFWVPRIQQHSSHYYIVKVPTGPKPRLDWRAPRPFVIYDYILSAVFLTLAIRLIEPSRDDISMRTIMGAVLFQAGLVTAVMTFYAIFRSCCRRCFQWQDVLTIIALGVSIYLNQTLKQPWRLPAMSKAGTWRLFCGISILEAVFIYVISRGLFLLPTKDDTIDMMLTDVDSWQQSIALGLTHDYFQRIKQVGEFIKSAPGHRVQVSYQNPGESRDEDSTRLTDEMFVPCVFVAVSHYVDWRGGSPSSPRRENFIRSGRLLGCQIAGTGSADDSWLCVTGIRQGYILDVSPSPKQTIIGDILVNPKFQSDAERKTQYQREVHRFSQRLAWLLLRAGLQNYVKVIEFENDIMQYLPVACKDVWTELQHVNSTGQSQYDEEAGGGEGQPSLYQAG